MFNTRFNTDDRGPLNSFLGMRVTENAENITIDQETYIKSLLSRYGMSECRPVLTPMVDDKLITTEGQPLSGIIENERNYKSVVGALLHLAKHTRPDLSCTVCTLAKVVLTRRKKIGPRLNVVYVT